MQRGEAGGGAMWVVASNRYKTMVPLGLVASGEACDAVLIGDGGINKCNVLFWATCDIGSPLSGWGMAWSGEAIDLWRIGNMGYYRLVYDPKRYKE